MTDPNALTMEKLQAAFDLLKGPKDMGCDIHMWVEYRPHEPQPNGRENWWAIIKCYNPGRDYEMFGLMNECGRGGKQLYDTKMLPDDVSFDVEEAFKEDTDLHSHSWLTGDEYAHCLATRMLESEWGPPDVGWDVVLVAMKAFEERGIPTRVIFAFDN